MYNKLISFCLLDGNICAQFNCYNGNKPDKCLIVHEKATNRHFL